MANFNSRRRELTKLLIGEEEFQEDAVFYSSPKQRKKEGGIWILPLEYLSRSYPIIKTGDEGETSVDYKRDGIKALILEPDKSKNKAVIALHGHGLKFNIGKSEPAGLKGDKDFHYGLELAKRGYNVLCFDFLPFEGRRLRVKKNIPYWDERFVKQDHSLDKVELMGLYVIDTMTGVDVLNNRYDLDGIGVIGISLAGHVGIFSMACDERIKAGVSACGINTYRCISDNKIVHNWSWTVHGMKRDFGEFHKLFELIAPRPVFVTAGKDDGIFPIEGVRDAFRWGKGYYKKANVPDNLKLREFEGGHEYPEEVREESYRFLDEHL